MTTAILLGASAAFLALGVGGWAMTRRRPGRIDAPEDAVGAAEGAAPGFVARDAIVGADAQAALVVGEDSRLIVVKVEGARLAARAVEWRIIRAVPDGMLVETGDRRFGAVLLARVDALDMRRLSPGRVSG